MGFEFDIFGDRQLQPDFIEWLVEERSIEIQRHFAKLWEYYANPMVDIYEVSNLSRRVNESGRCYLQAQEYGLPARITGMLHSAKTGVFAGEAVKDIQRKEVVIENEIEGADYYERINMEAKENFLALGVKEVRFSPEDEKWFLDLARESSWAAVEEMMTPEMYTRVRAVMEKPR